VVRHLQAPMAALGLADQFWAALPGNYRDALAIKERASALRRDKGKAEVKWVTHMRAYARA
jgi:hypothetical protein